VVDRVLGKHHQTYEVVFVATLEGRLKKMARIPGEDKTCVIGKWIGVIENEYHDCSNESIRMLALVLPFFIYVSANRVDLNSILLS
jgi:hypothetical protein